MVLNKNAKKIVLPLFKVLTLINKVIYKNPKKIVIYSNLGFRDNARILYDYLIENNYNEKYKIICSLNDYKSYKENKVANVSFTSNLVGLYHFSTSKFFFYSFGKYPIKPSAKQMVINLWHGTPLKKIGNLEADKKDIDYNYFTYVLATSKTFANVMKEAFCCMDHQVAICGHPRNDLLFKEKLPIYEDAKKLIVWMPTFRKSDILNEKNSTLNSGIPIFTNQKKMKALDDYLNKFDISLIIKLHPLQNTEGINFNGYRNIQIWTEDEVSQKQIHLYRLLGSSDALITDYSSVYFDYLLLDRPIGFTIEDIDEYSENRGLIFENPGEYMPGYKIRNEEDFYTFVDKVIKNIDDYSSERKRVNEIANYYKDGKNCERVLKIAGVI